MLTNTGENLRISFTRFHRINKEENDEQVIRHGRQYSFDLVSSFGAAGICS